jgi:hypothetical protein
VDAFVLIYKYILGGDLIAQTYTEARRVGNKKWDAANLDRVSVAMPKRRKTEIQAHAKDRGESVNIFINRAIMETMERDGSGK